MTRNRVVVFRVTEEEYRHLRHTCVERGGRSLSDFTRTELLALLKSSGNSDEGMSLVARKLAHLQYSVQHMIRLMENAETREGLNQGY